MDITTLLRVSFSSFPNVLAGFDPDYRPDEELTAEIERLSGAPVSFSIDEYQLETNLVDVARLLDRLLITRKELWDLETLRQRMALGYISTLELADADAQLSLALADPQNMDAVRTAVEAKVDATRHGIEALESRHAQEGGALNFKERIAKLRNSFRDDIESCHVRSESIIAGIKARYDLRFSRPDLHVRTYATFPGAAYLDDWASWHRQLSRKLEVLTSRASNFEVAIPLTTSRLIETFVEDENKWGETGQLLDEFALTHIKRGEKVTFTLETFSNPPFLGAEEGFITFFMIPSAAGVTAIQELAVQVDVQIASRKDGWRFEVEVHPPQSFAPVIVNVDSSSPDPAWITSATISNRPARGSWALRFLSASAVDTPAKQVTRNEWPIAEIRLLLRLQGVVLEENP